MYVYNVVKQKYTVKINSVQLWYKPNFKTLVQYYANVPIGFSRKRLIQ